MAQIVDNTQGGRRMIRLSSADISMILAMVQQEFRGAAATYETLDARLASRPFYLPEDLH